MLFERGRFSRQCKTRKRKIANTENAFGLRREPSCVGPCKCRD